MNNTLNNEPGAAARIFNYTMNPEPDAAGRFCIIPCIMNQTVNNTLDIFNNTLNPEPDAAGRILKNTLNTDPYAE